MVVLVKGYLLFNITNLRIEMVWQIYLLCHLKLMNKIVFREWKREKEKLKDEKKPSLLLAMVRAFGPLYAAFGVFVFLEVTTKCYTLPLRGF